ncbi:hypothetical protein [Leptospira noguchii]|nr:hypothetical protein [Leptospira noguchii]
MNRILESKLNSAKRSPELSVSLLLALGKLKTLLPAVATLGREPL